MKQIHTHFLYLTTIIILFFILFKCNTKPDVKPDINEVITKIETQIEHHIDTIYIPKEIYIKSDQSIVKVDETNTYGDSTFKYYNQIFKDSNYNLITYGGFVDSIDLSYKCNDMIIYDSTIVLNTITTYTTTMYKHSISAEYLWNGNQNILLDYTRNFNRLGVGVKAGINIDTKQPLLGVGLKYHFN